MAETSQANIQHWFYCLKEAGYIKIIGKRHSDTGYGMENIYRLTKNTGLEAPTQKGLNFLYDPNTQEYWAKDKSKLPMEEPDDKPIEIAKEIIPDKKIKVKSIEELKKNWKEIGGKNA
ncbi:MAG: hypothetical protein L7F77_11380 [Candidatus Magnetominusculus sp. LBB02]|nr:hypothetical protein [Candidatus Magnetominusculus sp. LBB02]